MPARGSSVPRIPGPGDSAALPPKPQFKKQKSITDLLSMPNNEQTTFAPFSQPLQLSDPPKIAKEPYNPYAQSNDYQKSLFNQQMPFSYNVPQSQQSSNHYPVTTNLNQPTKVPEPVLHQNSYIAATNPHFPDYTDEDRLPAQAFHIPEPPPKPMVQLPPAAPRGPPGRAPPPPPPPPPPGYLTEDLQEVNTSAPKLKIQRGKIGQVQAQLEHDREEKRWAMEEEKRQREREERERREREERERREREERERREREEIERREREEQERRERLEREEQERRERMEREELLKKEQEKIEREEQFRREREEHLRREREREEKEMRAREETAALLERQIRENEELEIRERELKREIERIRLEQERLQREELEREKFRSRTTDEVDRHTNGHERYANNEFDNEDDFPWTHTISEMEKMEMYEEEPKEAVEIEVDPFRMDIGALKIPKPPPPPPVSSFERLPPPPPSSTSSKLRRTQQSPTPGDSYKKVIRFIPYLVNLVNF
jgi:hypothetical protein